MGEANRNMTPDDLEDRLLDFAVRIGRLVEALPALKLGRHISGQLIRSGTSPAPNYAEGCAAESRRDFIHKLSISLKELRETRMWVRLIIRSQLIPEWRMVDLLDETEQLSAIIAKSIITAKRNGEDNEEEEDD